MLIYLNPELGLTKQIAEPARMITQRLYAIYTYLANLTYNGDFYTFAFACEHTWK